MPFMAIAVSHFLPANDVYPEPTPLERRSPWLLTVLLLAAAPVASAAGLIALSFAAIAGWCLLRTWTPGRSTHDCPADRDESS